jgi:hypothetical protein
MYSLEIVEAGKLALKKTEPSFLHNLFVPNASNPFVQMSSKIVEKERLRRLPQKMKNADPKTDASAPKMVKTNNSQSAMDSTANKKLNRIPKNPPPQKESVTAVVRNSMILIRLQSKNYSIVLFARICFRYLKKKKR